MVKNKLSPLYLKLILFSFVFVLFLLGFFFALQFYAKKIIKQLENIALLKKEIAQNQSLQEKELKFRYLKNFFEQTTGKEISAVLFDIQQILNPDFEKTKELLLKKFNDEKWQIVSTSFNFEEGRLNFVLKVPFSDISKFLDFFINRVLIIKIENLKIQKNENDYNIEISLKLK